jgi:predicted TIM-barrel fold metal-dependent hydrolase
LTVQGKDDAMKVQRQLIDWHMHVWEPDHLGPEYGGQLDARYKDPISAMASFEDADAARREAGIECAVAIALVSPHLRMGIPNEFIAEYVERNRGTTLGFASVDPNDSRAPDDLRYAIETLGLHGLKLSPPYQAFHPHSPEAFAVYRRADELGVPVMFHQGAVFARRGILEWANAALLDMVAREFPEMRIIIAHGGQPWYTETVALMSKHPNVWTDLSARFHRPWQLHNIILAAIDYRVADRILFGTDFPCLRPQFCIDALRSLNETNQGRLPDIPAELIDQILYERPFSLLGLAP